MDKIDVTVIGAGVIGLAVARAFARAGRSVVILERETDFGTGISSRSSEVIHAGMHYPRGSLKERLCIGGKRQLYDYCQSHKVPHRRTGKLTVATSASEVPRLEGIASHARDSGADAELSWLDGEEARRLEPELACEAALLSPSSGIIDSRAYMLSLLGEAEDHGAMLARATPVTRLVQADGVWRVEAAGDAIACDAVINAAGLDAPALARRTEGLDPHFVPVQYLAKGSYFAWSGASPFSRLIYPLPIIGGLGVHLTLDMGGQIRFGPDVEWMESHDYVVDPAKATQFAEAVRRFWPGLDSVRLAPAYAGIRPNLSGPKGTMADFRIEGPEVHGLPGLVNLFGIDSPGLTSSLAIAGHVAGLLYGD